MARKGLRPGYRSDFKRGVCTTRLGNHGKRNPPLSRLDLADTGAAIGLGSALPQPRFDMRGGWCLPGGHGVEEDVEHAASAGKLQLTCIAFGQIDARRTETLGERAGVLPDQVTIFMEPILGMCETRDEVVEEVRITVVHEIAHHFGIDDARLEELGYE